MSYTGTWNTVTKTPMGDQEIVIELVEQDGEITGTMKITLGHTVELDGDSVTGTVKLGVFGSAEIIGTRA